jgi:hypothetical protein
VKVITFPRLKPSLIYLDVSWQKGSQSDWQYFDRR